MPIFEFRCPECDTRFERLVRSSSPVQCPSCGTRRIERLLSVPARPVTAAPVPGPCGDAAQNGSCCGGGMCELN